MSCKRPCCTLEALPYPRYEGYCSNECRDTDEYEQEIATLTKQVKTLQHFAQLVRTEVGDARYYALQEQAVYEVENE